MKGLKVANKLDDCVYYYKRGGVTFTTPSLSKAKERTDESTIIVEYLGVKGKITFNTEENEKN